MSYRIMMGLKGIIYTFIGIMAIILLTMMYNDIGHDIFMKLMGVIFCSFYVSLILTIIIFITVNIRMRDFGGMIKNEEK